MNYEKWLKANKDQVESIILTEAFNWIDRLQNQYGASKPLTSPYCLIGNKDWTSLGVAKNTTDKDKITYRTSWRRDKHDINQLFMVFNCFQGGGDPQKFSSSEILFEMFSRENGAPIPVNTSPKVKEQARQKANNKLKKQAISSKKEAIKKREAVKYFNNEVYPSLSLEGESTYFSENKNFPSDFWQGKGLRFGNDANLKYIKKNGNFAAIQLKSALNDEPLGLALIYDDGTKKLTYGTQKADKIPYAVFGNIETSDILIYLEGVADCLLTFYAYQLIHPDENIAVIYCVDAGNLKAVVETFAKRYPGKEGLVICDNDQWKYGHANNVGLLKGIGAAKQAGYRYIYPDFSEYDQSSKPTDLSDLYQLGGLEAVIERLKKQIIPPKRYEWPLLRLSLTGLRAIKEGEPKRNAFSELYKAVKFGCHRFCERIPLEPFENILDEILTAIDSQSTRLGQYPHFDQDELEKLKEYATQQFSKIHKNTVKRFNTPFSPKKIAKLEEKGVRVIRYDLELIDGKYRIPKKISEQIINTEKGLHAVYGPKDTGKTFSVIKPLIEEGMLENKRPTAITPLRSLTRDVGNKCELDNYQDIKNTDDTQGLGITINSIINPRFSKYLEASQLIVIDEIDAVYDSILIGTVKKEDKEKTYKALQKLLRKEKVVVASADIDDNCLDELMKACNPSEITLYLAKPTPLLSGCETTIFEEPLSLEDFQKQVNSGVPCILTSDNVDLIEQQNEKLVKLGIKTLCITKNTVNNSEVKEFFEAPNKYIKKHKIQALLYTPAMATGVSIDEKHFEFTYGVYYQQTTENGFLQQLFRSRPTKKYCLAFPSRKEVYELRDEAKERIRKEIVAAYKESLSMSNGKWKVEEIFLSDFDNARANALVAQSQEKNPNDILLRLMAEGMKITYQKDTSGLTQAKAELKADRKAFKKAKIDEILEADKELSKLTPNELNDITQEAIKKDKENLSLDPIYKAALIRHKYYRDAPLDRELIEFDLEGGMSKCLYVESYLTNQETVIQLDKLEQKITDISLHRNETLRQYFNKYFLDALSIRIDKDFDLTCDRPKFNKKSELIKGVINFIVKNKDAFNGCMPKGKGVIFTDRTAREPMRFIGNWLKLFGLKLNSSRSDKNAPRDYEIDFKQYDAFIVPFLKGREQQGKNHLVNKIREYKEYLLNEAVTLDEAVITHQIQPAENESSVSDQPMPIPVNQLMPVPKTTCELENWANPNLAWHERIEDFYLKVKKGLYEDWIEIKNTNPFKWNELKAELEQFLFYYLTKELIN